MSVIEVTPYPSDESLIPPIKLKVNKIQSIHKSDKGNAILYVNNRKIVIREDFDQIVNSIYLIINRELSMDDNFNYD